MKSLSQVILEEEVNRRSILLEKCQTNLEAGIKATDTLKAVQFVTVILSTNLQESKYIVEQVKEGKGIYVAYCEAKQN